MAMRDSVNKSLLRAISVMRSFTPTEVELGLSDIARKTGLPTTTVHRILTTMTQGGLLERSMRGEKYRIGPEFYILGSLYLRRSDIVSASEPVIKALNDLTDEAVAISALYQNNVVVILKEESKHPFRIVNHAGSILVAHASAMGKALLSELSREEFDQVIPEEKLQRITKNTITTKTELMKQLENIRETGISFDFEGNYEGVVGIASIIRNAIGNTVAAMSIGLPAFRANEVTCNLVSALVKMSTQLISYRLGYRDKAHPVRDLKEIRLWWEQNRLAITS